MGYRRSIHTCVGLLILLTATITACDSGKVFVATPTTSVATVVPTETPTKLPDLIVVGIALLDPNIGSADAYCEPITWPQQIILHLKNQGDGTAGTFIVQVNDTWQTVPAGIGAGESIRLQFWIDTEQVTAIVDPDSQVIESNEINNHASKLVILPTPPAGCLAVTPISIIPTAQSQIIMSGHSAAVLSVSFSPDGSLIASGSVDNTMRLWRVSEGNLLRTMRGHPFPVTAIDFSPNGILLATGSTDSKLRIWRISDGSLQRTMEGHAGWITSIDISPNGNFLASSAQDYTVRIWRISDGRLYEMIDEGMAQVNSVKFTPDSRAIAWCEIDGTVRLRSINGNWLQTLKGSSIAAISLALSPDGKWLAVGYVDGTVHIWQTADGQKIGTLESHTVRVTSVAFSPNGNWLASASQDGTIRLWRILGSEIETSPAWILSGHSTAINSIAFSPTSTVLASGADDKTIRLWEIPPAAGLGE